MLVMALTLVGNGLGFIRDVVLTALFGASAETDAFVVAWTVPETFSPLLMEGLIPLVLTPWLVRHTSREGLRDAMAKALAPTAVVTVTLAVLVALGAPLLVTLLAPELVEKDLAVTCVRLAAATIPAMAIAGVLSATLRSGGRLVLPALVYSAYNVGILVTTFVLHERWGVAAAALGLTVGAAAMVLVQVPAMIGLVGMPGYRRVHARTLSAGLMVSIPTLAYLIARQGQVFVERFVGSTLEAGSITYLNLAQKLGQLPVTLALAMALVSFPSMARHVHLGDLAAARALATKVLVVLVTILVPAAAAFLVVAEPIVLMAFGRGEFDSEAVQSTASTLSVYAAGLPAQAIVTTTMMGMFAVRRGSWVPSVWLSLALVLTAVIAAVAAPQLGTQGIALANASAITVAAVGLTSSAHRAGLVNLGRLLTGLRRSLVASALAALLTVMIRALLSPGPFLELAVGVVVFALVYVAVDVATRGGIRADLGLGQGLNAPQQNAVQ